MTRHRSWWGWGWEDAAVEGAELDRLAGMLAAVLGDAGIPRRAPVPEDLGLRAPRIAVPDALAAIADGTDHARAAHSHGQSLSDVVAMLEGDLSDPCDWVLRPAGEDGVAAVLDWCTAAGIAAIPWGGGTSVVGGVTPHVGDGYPGVVSLDLSGLDRVLEVDLASRAARVQAGMLGPALEEALRPHGLTLRHQPQSYEFSSVGGWLATRSAGHHSTLHTHLDDRVEGMRALTPRGALETRRLPASGAGPSPDRLLLGSEGALAVITEAWLRLVERPLFRARATVRFATFPEGAAAARALGQSMLLPATCRLVDAAEAFVNRVGDGSSSLLLLGFEAAGHPVDAALRRALELCSDHGGTADPPPDPARDTAGTWRDAFVRLPYVRDAVARLGHIVETFETAVTWDRMDELWSAVMERTAAAVAEVCGAGLVTCRLTHVYPDGCAPYFTVIARSRHGDQRSQWAQVKAAASEAILAAGGTITHHHAVGRDHRPWYDRQRPDLAATALAAAKRALDPAWILNPGVLLPVP
ncbi:MAG TPA: FAD-binding oxidoreductase [Candidatus Dormibacteraeota bacterium]|nr:FAD-binding oxidoreductase [Candidatus Dormibacteraeota bacterium]